MLPFIRSDLAQITAYKAHPGSDTAQPVATQLDRLDTNESPYDLPSELKEKLAYNYQKLIENNRYPDGGHETLKQAIAEYVNESAGLKNSIFTAANISIGNGSDELIRSLLIATCVGGEGTVLVANPTFSMYAVLAQTLGIPVVSIGRDENTFEMDLTAAQAVIEKTQNPPIRTVFVVHPNSPTGNSLTEAEISWLTSLPEEILVVIDEAYFEFSQNTLAGELIKHPNWVIMRTFSKAFRLAALRVGYCIGHPEAIATLEKIRLPYNMSNFSLLGATFAMQNRQIILSSIPQILSQRDQLIATLSSHPALNITPSTANFIYLRLKSQIPLNHLHQQLRNQGTLVRLLTDALRISIGTPEENDRTIQHLQAALANL